MFSVQRTHCPRTVLEPWVALQSVLQKVDDAEEDAVCNWPLNSAQDSVPLPSKQR